MPFFFFADQVDRLEEKEKIFFAECLKNFKKEDTEKEFNKIKEGYKKAIEDATEKVQAAEECYGLVDRYLRKLDEELHKFKMELEADNRGITEILEKQSLEMDAAPHGTHLKENRLPKKVIVVAATRIPVCYCSSIFYRSRKALLVLKNVP